MSDLKTTVRTDMQQAMKDHDQVTLSTLRMVLSAITAAEVAGDEMRELSDAEVVKIIQGQVSARRDSAAAYEAGNRPELAAKELGEVEVLQRYLPAELTDAELTQIVDEEVARATPAGEKATMRQMGPIMKAVGERVAGRADGKKVAAAVKAKLA